VSALAVLVAALHPYIPIRPYPQKVHLPRDVIVTDDVLTVFSSIFMAWRAIDSATIRAFMIILGDFRINFAISLITCAGRRHLK
jgi:hypothetical protein